VRAKDQLIYSLFSDAASATTLKMAKPIIQTPASRTGCAGDVITLTTSAEYTSYAWNSGQTTKSIAVTATGIFQVQVTDAFRCTSDYSDPVSVTILNYPVVDLIYDGTKITVKGEAQSYQWYLNEQLIPGATTTVLTPAQSGEYRLVAKNGTCETKSAPLQIVITGVENPLTDQIDIYPIPAFESLSVEMKESLRNAEVSLQLVSVNGSVLSNAIKEQGKLKTNLPTRHLPAGVYFLLIRSANYRLYKRVVISH
jgi:archaellum component FlaF (FlaF/FlaG flagellin family)